MIRRNSEFATGDRGSASRSTSASPRGVGCGEAGKLITVQVGGGRPEDGVWLRAGRAVENDSTTVQVDAVSGDGDDTLDQVHRGVDWVVEDYEVAAMDLVGRGEGRKCRLGADLLVDEQKVTGEGGEHGFGGDPERLSDKGDDEQRYRDDVEERLERLQKSMLREGPGCGCGERDQVLAESEGSSAHQHGTEPDCCGGALVSEAVVWGSAERRRHWAASKSALWLIPASAMRAASCWACFGRSFSLSQWDG